MFVNALTIDAGEIISVGLSLKLDLSSHFIVKHKIGT